MSTSGQNGSIDGRKLSLCEFLTHIGSMMYTVLMTSSFQMNMPSKNDQYNDRKEGYNHNYSYDYCWQHNIWQPSRPKWGNQLVTVTPTNYSWSYIISVCRMRRGIATSRSRVEWYFWSNDSLHCAVAVLPEKHVVNTGIPYKVDTVKLQCIKKSIIVDSYLRNSRDTQLVAESDHLLSTPQDTVFDLSKFEVKTWPWLKI